MAFRPSTGPHLSRPAAVPRTFGGADAALRSGARVGADFLVLLAVAAILFAVIQLTRHAAGPIEGVATTTTISTEPSALPYYAARSLLRMFAALLASMVFTFIYATVAARSRRAEKVLIPLLDILQSVPVLGFLSVTLTFWLWLFPGREFGVEMASIFAIFTAQVWNLTFAFYQSQITVPRELDEASRLMRLTKWQRFWQLDVPHATIPLVWNGMMSFGGGWFFLIASEVILVNNQEYALPGIGSYVAAASERQQIPRILLAIAVMVLMVVGTDFFFWRPLTAWSERFRIGDGVAAEVRSPVLSVIRRSGLPDLIQRVLVPIRAFFDRLTRPFGLADVPLEVNQVKRRVGDLVFAGVVGLLIAYGAFRMLHYLASGIGLHEFLVALGLGFLTFLRVLVLLVISTLIWVPIGVWIGLNPKVSRIAQPVVQVLASFPANFLFPFVTMLLLRTGISLNIGGIFLMALGAQWYILFNVIAGAAAIPQDLREATTLMRVPMSLKWRTLYGPAILTSWVTGAITASGGAWNASIVAEVVSYGNETLTARGLGAYITEATARGDFARTLVGVIVMSAFVVGLNRLLWKPLNDRAVRRYTLT